MQYFAAVHLAERQFTYSSRDIKAVVYIRGNVFVFVIFFRIHLHNKNSHGVYITGYLDSLQLSLHYESSKKSACDFGAEYEKIQMLKSFCIGQRSV